MKKLLVISSYLILVHVFHLTQAFLPAPKVIRTFHHGVKSSISTSSNETQTKIAFIIQKLPERPSKVDCERISSIVIDVFFQEEAERSPEKRSKGFPTKPLILAYLKNLQFGDVRGKRYLLGNANNSMFVARRLKKIGTGYLDPAYGYSKSDLNELGSVYNIESLPESEKGYELGEILGFVDVTEKAFGLPDDKLASSISDGITNRQKLGDRVDNNNAVVTKPLPMQTKSNEKIQRPVLTNLSVTPAARGSGVGSALVDVCEYAVMNEWSRTYSEIILEVEDENKNAQMFYEKRGYVALFSDPTSRRFDASGLILRDERTTKICYRKDLSVKNEPRTEDALVSTDSFFQPSMFFARVKNAIRINK